VFKAPLESPSLLPSISIIESMVSSLLEKVANKLLNHFDASEFIRHKEGKKDKTQDELKRRRRRSESRHRNMSVPRENSNNDHVHDKPERRRTHSSSTLKNNGVDFKIPVFGLKVNVQKDCHGRQGTENKIRGILKCSVLLRLKREVGRRRGYLQVWARHAKAYLINQTLFWCSTRVICGSHGN